MPRSLRGIVRTVAAFDLALTALLVWPGISIEILELLYRVNAFLGGDVTLPGFHAIHDLFVSLAGVLGVLWAVARLLDPRPLLAGLDVAGRLVVAALIAVAVVGGQAPALLFAFVATELLGAGWQVVALVGAEGPEGSPIGRPGGR